jgi:hypothetical protein
MDRTRSSGRISVLRTRSWLAAKAWRPLEASVAGQPVCLSTKCRNHRGVARVSRIRPPVGAFKVFSSSSLGEAVAGHHRKSTLLTT